MQGADKNFAVTACYALLTALEIVKNLDSAKAKEVRGRAFCRIATAVSESMTR